MLGCGAHLTQLHRSAIGPWSDPGPDRTATLTGRELLPWAPSRMLSDQEVGELRQERTIPAVTILAPDWTLPAGFPDPQPPVRGFHLGRLSFLLRVEEQRLRILTALRGGL
jgi:tRNA pseudouridine55 synthase